MDITKCLGTNCLVKDKCKRFTAKSHERQSFFSSEPFEIKDGKFDCKMFWGDQAESILQSLQNIMKN